MKSIKLSHSQIETFKQCSEKYRLHYIERLREDKIHSPLFFGSALDAAIESLLKAKQNNHPIDFDPTLIFDAKFNETELNGSKILIPTNPKVVYLKSDFDKRLLTKEDYEEILEEADITKDNIDLFYNEIYQMLNNGMFFEEITLKLYNFINWLSLRRKGHLLIKAYQEQILPKIKKVYEIQKPITLTNEDGDSLIGFIDFIGEWETGEKVIFDNKTSSRKYGPNTAKESQQLSIYGEHEENYKVGYIVLIKTIKFVKHKMCTNCEVKTTRKVEKCLTKACVGEWTITEVPEVDTQVIIDTLDPEYQTRVFEEIQGITASIKAGEFEQNRDACYSFGRKCQYYDLCRQGIKDGLISMKKEDISG